jgi:hypothetical protein
MILQLVLQLRIWKILVSTLSKGDYCDFYRSLQTNAELPFHTQ